MKRAPPRHSTKNDSPTESPGAVLSLVASRGGRHISSSDARASTVSAPLEPVRNATHRATSPRGDRKSTRLNSSHTVISYAVFCLKKKKKKNRTTRVVSRAHR